MISSTTLTRKATVHELVATYQQAVKDILSAFQTLSAAEKRMNDVYTLEGFATIRIQPTSNAYPNWGDPNDAIKRMRKDAWRVIVERLELRRIMSIARTQKLADRIDKDDMPEITLETVGKFVDQYAGNLEEIHKEAVTEVYEMLRPRPRSNRPLKTNSEFRIGKRVILEGYIAECWFTCFQTNYHYQQNLTALENVMSALDGKGQINKTHRSALQNAIEACPLSGDGRGETEYFRFRCCRNRNLHLEFKRPDLIKRLNEIAGNRTFKQAS